MNRLNVFYLFNLLIVLCATAQVQEAWVRRYNNGVTNGTNQAIAIALDSSGNIIVAIPSDFATLEYDTNGNEKWVKRYDGPANGNDEGKAIAVDVSRAVYVAGTSANTNGGTDIVLIKYVELQSVRVLTNGHAFLQFFGTSGTNYRFQASLNLSN
jgi:hypothetical protein